MPYDEEKICNDYVNFLDSFNYWKAQAKEWDRHIAALNLLTDEFEEGRAGYKALMTVHRIAIQRKNAIGRAVIISKKQSDRATKAYQEYCAKKETK